MRCIDKQERGRLHVGMDLLGICCCDFVPARHETRRSSAGSGSSYVTESFASVLQRANEQIQSPPVWTVINVETILLPGPVSHLAEFTVGLAPCVENVHECHGHHTPTTRACMQICPLPGSAVYIGLIGRIFGLLQASCNKNASLTQSPMLLGHTSAQQNAAAPRH